MKLLVIAATLIAFLVAPLHVMESANHINIKGEVTWKTYDKVAKTIQDAPFNGVLFVYIDSPGGDATAGDEIANQLKHCRANVVTVIDGCVASVAFNILIAGDYVFIDHSDMILIHAAYVRIGGMDLHTFPGLHATHIKQISDYKGYLTAEEEKFIFEEWGDLILSPEVFLERVDNDITHLKQLKGEQNGSISSTINPTRFISSR